MFWINFYILGKLDLIISLGGVWSIFNVIVLLFVVNLKKYLRLYNLWLILFLVFLDDVLLVFLFMCFLMFLIRILWVGGIKIFLKFILDFGVEVL